jgi:hypothetical protein
VRLLQGYGTVLLPGLIRSDIMLSKFSRDMFTFTITISGHKTVVCRSLNTSNLTIAYCPTGVVAQHATM